MLDINTNEYNETFTELSEVLEKKRHVHPSRFEELVGYFFKNIGYTLEYTNKTRDGGYDLILLVDGEKYAIVEVKDWKNKITIELIRQLRGVQFETQSKQAFFVTSSSFTNDAIISAAKPVSSHQINLFDADTILNLLKIKKSKTSLTELNKSGELFTIQKNKTVDSAVSFEDEIGYNKIRDVLKLKLNEEYDYTFVKNGEIAVEYGWFSIGLDLMNSKSTSSLTQKANILTERINYYITKDKHETIQDKELYYQVITNHFKDVNVINRLFLSNEKDDDKDGIRDLSSIPFYQLIKLNKYKFIEFNFSEISDGFVIVWKRDLTTKRKWISLLK